MQSLSRFSRAFFWVLLLGLLILGVFALLNQPLSQEAMQATQNEMTVQALLGGTVTPDLRATANARLTETAQPTPDVGERIVDAGEGMLGFFTGTYQRFGIIGLCLQLLCCVILPVGAVLALVRESRQIRH